MILRVLVDLCLMHESLEPVLPAFDSYSAPLEGSYWSMTSRPNEPVHAGWWNQDNFFTRGQGWGTMMPALSSDPGEYRLALSDVETLMPTD